MESKGRSEPSPTDPPFSNDTSFSSDLPNYSDETSQISPNDLFKLLVYTKHTSLSRLKLVENVDEKKEFLILQGSNRTIHKLRSRLLNLYKEKGRINISKSALKEYTNFLEEFKKYDGFFKKSTDHCGKCKLPSETSTSISIDYNMFRRSVPPNDTENPKYDPNEYLALENSLNLIKSRYNYDFSKLVSYQNIIYQIFLFDSHEFHLMAKYNQEVDPSLSSQLRLNNAFPTLYYVYSEIAKHRAEFLEKISFNKRLSVSNSVDKFSLSLDPNDTKEETLETVKFQSKLTQRNSFDTLVSSLYKTLEKHDVLLNIRIFNLSKSSASEVESAIFPVFKEILDEMQTFESDYYPWIRLFRESYTVSENPKVEYIYNVFNSVLDFSFNNKLFSLTDLLVDVIFSFSIRNPDFCSLLQSFTKYFKSVLWPSNINYISELLSSTSDSYSNIFIPTVPNLESVSAFEYLALQYPILSHKTDNSPTKEMSSIIPKIGNFVVRIDVEILDRIDVDKLYMKKIKSFNFKLYIKNHNKIDRTLFLIGSQGRIFFATECNNTGPVRSTRGSDHTGVSDGRMKLFNKGSRFLSIELLFSDSTVSVFSNGIYFMTIQFVDSRLDFFQLDFSYNLENVNVRQFSTLSPGFRKFLIQTNLIHHHMFITNDNFTTITLDSSVASSGVTSSETSSSVTGSSEEVQSTRSELESEGYIRRVFDYFSFFSMALSSVHTAVANVNFNISLENSFNPLNSKAFESLNIMFELLLNMFELVSDTAFNCDYNLISSVGYVNVVTLWRHLSESIISVLSVVKIFFSLPITMEEVPLLFLNNLTKILFESIKYKSHFDLEGDFKEYHHPIDLISLANSVNLISLDILGSNQLISKQLFSTSPTHFLSEILVNIAYTTSYFVTDLTILTKNTTLNALNQGLCIEIFTKRALSEVFDQPQTSKSGTTKATKLSNSSNLSPTNPSKVTNMWWNLIHELLEADKLSLQCDTGSCYNFCTCNSRLNDLSLLDPMFNYCTFCLRKYFNYFSSISSLNYHTTKLYSSESFYSIPRPSMLLCRFLLKHGITIMLFNSFCSRYNRAKSGSSSESESESDSDSSSVDESIFEEYYLSLFEPSNLVLVEDIFIYLLKLKEHILYIISGRVDLLSKYLLDYFGLLLHNFISCLSLLDLFSYFSEFMESIRTTSKYLFHIVTLSCVNLLPYLIKVLLLYNKIFRCYSAKYQKFTPFMNYLIYQFSSLLLIFMKIVHFVYENVDTLDYNILKTRQHFSLDKNELESNCLKDPNYKFRFPKCIVSTLNFTFVPLDGRVRVNTSTDGNTSDSTARDSTAAGNIETITEPVESELEMIGSLRKLLLLVQDFKYVKGTSVSFRNVPEIESFISNSADFESDLGLGTLTRGLLNMESWATKIFSDSFDQLYPRLVALRYTLIALFTHLLIQQDSQSDPSEYSLEYESHFMEYLDSKKYASVVCMKILSKFQAMNSMQNIKNKDSLRETYLEDVASRCIWLIKNTSSGHFSQNSSDFHSTTSATGTTLGRSSSITAERENLCRTVSKMKTSTYNMVDHKTRLRSGTAFRRSNSSTNLNKSSQDSSKLLVTSGQVTNFDVDNALASDRTHFSSGADTLGDNFADLVDFILNGPPGLECEKRFLIHRLSSLVRISLLSSLKALIYSFLDLGYVSGNFSFTHNYSPLVVDLLVNTGNTGESAKNQGGVSNVKNLNDTLDLFWYIMINKLRPIMLCTFKDSKFELVNGTKYVPNIYNRVVYDYLCSILENVCDWYIRSGITTIDSTNYNRPNMNFWLGISLSFFSLVYSLGLEPMTDTRYSYQIFNYMMSILHPLPLLNFKKAMANQTSLSCYTVEVALVVYVSDHFVTNFEETVENLFHCLKMRKFTRKDQLILPGGTIYLMVKKSSKISENLKQDHPINLNFTHLWSFPKIENTSHGLGHYLIYNFDVNFDQSNTNTLDTTDNTINHNNTINHSNSSNPSNHSYPTNLSNSNSVNSSNSNCVNAGSSFTSLSALNKRGHVNLEENDIIMWRMENYWHLISEVSLSKRTSNNIALVINTSRDITVYLTLPKNITNRNTNEIELSLVNYLGGNLEIEGVNGTWTQVLGIKGLDYFYVVRSNLYLLLKYLLWVELSTNLHTNGVQSGKIDLHSGPSSSKMGDVGLVLGILFKYLRSTAVQIFNLSTACNCKDNPEKVSIKYHCSNISCQFKYSTTIKGYLVDSDNTADNLLVTRGCSSCSTNQIYKKELDFFWGNILSYLINLVRACENYNLVYLVLNSLLTTFTLGERQAQAFLSMDCLGQRFCNLLVVTIKQLSATSHTTSLVRSVTSGRVTGHTGNTHTTSCRTAGNLNKFGVTGFGYLKTVLASPKIHAVFVLKWLPPLKQVPLECIYATLRENFQSILISKSFKPVTKIEPNDPFVTLPHSDHFVTHRNSVDFEADISENTLQVIRANNMGGIVMYRIPPTLGTTAVQLTTNFYILNASRFGITVAPADCVFGTVSDLFERNDVVGFSHSNSLSFTSQLFAATIGYTIGDILTAHFTLDHQDDGQLCLRTELLIGGNSIGSVLEVVFDPITQNDPSRRMSLVFIFQDPATLVLRGSSLNPERGNIGPNTGTLSESNIINTFLTSNARREIPNSNDRNYHLNDRNHHLNDRNHYVNPSERNQYLNPNDRNHHLNDRNHYLQSNDRVGYMGDRSNSYPNVRELNRNAQTLERNNFQTVDRNVREGNVQTVERNNVQMEQGNEIIGSSNVEVVRVLDRIVSRETSATVRSRTVTEHSIPVSDHSNSIEPFPAEDAESYPTSDLTEIDELTELNQQNEITVNENVLTFNFAKYFNVEDSDVVSFDNVPEWDVKFDTVENESLDEAPITLCKDEFWDKLLRDDKYTCLFAQFSDSVQVYQSVLSVNVPMFSGLKRELVLKIKSSFDDLYTLLSSNFKYTRLESSVRDCFSWLCVLCCDHDRQVWENLSQKDFKVVSDFTLPFLLGSSFPSKTTLVTLPNELLLELFVSISKILTVRPVISTLTLSATKKGSIRFIHGDVQTDSLIIAIASKSLLASALILKVLSHRCFKVDLYSTTVVSNGIGALNADFLHLLDGLTNFIVSFLSTCSDDLVFSNNTIENVTFSNVQSILQSLHIDSDNITTQGTYRTYNNTLEPVELVLLVDVWNAIYSTNASYELIEESVNRGLKVKTMNSEFNVKMFGTCEKSFHTSSRIPSVRRHFMRRSQFYKLVEHDLFDLLQGLVHVFRDYFYRKILSQCSNTLSLFRSSILHFSTTFDSNSLEYYELADSNTEFRSGPSEVTRMNLFSAACDPLYSWQLLFYHAFANESDPNDRNSMAKVLFTELIYCMAISMSSTRYLKLLECVFWVLDTLPRHPLCPYALRFALTNKYSLSLLNFLFLNGVGSPPKLSQVSARITHKVIPSLSVRELDRLLELIMYFGTCAFLRVHSVCNYYSTSDLDMFTNFDHKRHDHTTRLSTANILHSFLTSFVIACEWADNSIPVSEFSITRNLEYSDFYNMGAYLYLARNKKLSNQMLSHLLSLTPEIYTSIPLQTANLRKDSGEKSAQMSDFGSFSTFTAKNTLGNRKNSAMLKSGPTILNSKQSGRKNEEVHFISCSDRYHGLVLKFKVELATRFVFSQYKNFSKVLAELIVSPPRTQELKIGQFYPLEEYVNNVPLIKYLLQLDPQYTYCLGYTTETTFTNHTFAKNPEMNMNRVYRDEKTVYILITGGDVAMYMTNNHIFWDINSITTSTYFKHLKDLMPFIFVNRLNYGSDDVSKCIVKLDSLVVIPVTNCYVKKHENEFGLLKVGNGFVVRPAIRTGLSVHRTKVSFSDVTPVDLSTSSLVTLSDNFVNLGTNSLNLEDEVMRFDPCLPFRLSFKFEKGFNVNVRPNFYVGLVSDREKLLWFSSGDLYVSTNFHVPSKDNEYRKIQCLPYYETDVISVSFNPEESSLYFTVSKQTVKLNFHSYYFHITNVYTDNIIASTNPHHGERDNMFGGIEMTNTNTNASLAGTSTTNQDNLDDGYTYADRRNLINAVIFDDLAKIKSFLELPCELFENGCDDHFDVDGHDYFLYSPIYIACNLGKLSLLKLMALNKNINFDVKSGPYKSTPLMGAVQGGHYHVVYYLLTIHSIDINAVDSSGHNCLYYSLFRSKEINFKIVELLLNFGADVHSNGRGLSISETLHSIPGNNNLHKKLIDAYKLQKGVFYKSNWSLLQNLHIFMSSKMYVKYNIKVDPSVLGPIENPPETSSPVTAVMSSPEFLSPDRRIDLPDETDILELMGNFLGKLTDDVKEGFNTTIGLLSEGLQHLHSSTEFSTKNSGFSALNSGISTNSINSIRNTSINSVTSKNSISKNSIGSGMSSKNSLNSKNSMNSLSSKNGMNGVNSNIKVVLNNMINEDTVQMSNLVMKYIEESLEIIRRGLYKLTSGLDEGNPLMKSVSNELNMTLKEFIIYHLFKFNKGIASETDEALRNFIALSNSLVNQLSECEGLSIVSETQYIMLKFVRFENKLVSFGIVNKELLFPQRLRRNSQLLKDLHIVDSYSFNLGFYIYTSSNNSLTDENFTPTLEKSGIERSGIEKSGIESRYSVDTGKNGLGDDAVNGRLGVSRVSGVGLEDCTVVGGNMYMFDRLRMELNSEMSFEVDRTLVSLLDLLKNSDNQLETLAKILIYSRNCGDMLAHLPPSDSHLWSPINISIETMFSSVQELRNKILKLRNTFPLSDMDLHLMYTVLWKQLNHYTNCEMVEDPKHNTEMKIVSLLQGLGLVNDIIQFGNYRVTNPDKIKGVDTKLCTNSENNLRYNFMNESSPNNEINLEGIGESLYIRTLSSPHLINRNDTNLSRNSGCSHLYLDLFNNNINRSDLTVNTTDAIVNGDLDENVLYNSNHTNTSANNINTVASNTNTVPNNINTVASNTNTVTSNDTSVDDGNIVVNYNAFPLGNSLVGNNFIENNLIGKRVNINEGNKGLEANIGANSGGHWNGRDLGSDYIFHSLSLIILADRIRYVDVISDVFRNVIPIISTILNQPLIQYRPINSLISEGFQDYYGIKLDENDFDRSDSSGSPTNNNTIGKRYSYDDLNQMNWNCLNRMKYSVCMGPMMPIHYTDYLRNKPLVKRSVLNEMYEKIFTLGSLSVDRPYFSVRVDRGIAHTTKLLRNSLWFQSTAQILNCNPNILRAKNNQRPFMVVFKGEGSTDFGGPFQELLTCISNEFMFPLTPDNDSQSATIKCQNTINNYGMHQDTVLIKFTHYPISNLFTENTSQLTEARGTRRDSVESSDSSNSIFTVGCCDLGVCCSSGCCCILSTFPFDEPVSSKDLGSNCRCGASELYSDSCSQSVPMELSMYESLGRLCAMCLCMMNPLNIAINPIIWKKLLCSNLKLIDLLDCDKMSVDLLQKFVALESTGAVTEADLNGLVFSLESAEGDTLDLVENGSNLPVSPSNLGKYLGLATLFRLTEGDLGCSFLAKGMNSVVPIGRLRTLLDPRSLEFVVCGDSLVDLAVLRAHTVSYSLNLKKDLFDVLSRFSNDMLQLFLRFVSGRSRLPHPNSDWCLRLEYDNKPDEDADKRLPTSATCSFRLLMPKYSSLDIMYKRLIYAIENCIAIDLDAHVVHDEMQLSIN